jgi:hypothetical protein
MMSILVFVAASLVITVVVWLLVRSCEPPIRECSVCGKKICYPERFFSDAKDGKMVVFCYRHGREIERREADPRKWPVDMGWM